MNEFPKHEMFLLKGWLDAVTVVLPTLEAREAEEERFRTDPRKLVKFPPKQGPKKRKDLKLALRDILEALRWHGFGALAEEVSATRKPSRRILLLSQFYREQALVYGDPEDRPTRKVGPPIPPDDWSDARGGHE